ncbi:MAG TPA: helix-turn-helix transcriptional regulator [Atopostipes sp.]|nr:helix-turn-helix transcriptional regulator [Atopostipes sp.]
MEFNLQKLRYERMSRRITQQEMADALGLNRSSYVKRESGDVKISVDEFSIILNRLGIPESEVANFFIHNVPIRERIAE